MASPKKFLILAKTEVTQFTDPVPTPGANSILVKNLTVNPLDVETEDRALMRPYFGNSEQIPVKEQAVIEFDVEIAGAGAAGTAAPYGPLLLACGFAETLVAVTSASYNPISSAFTFVTIYCYRDGLLYKLTGCAGNVTFNWEAKKLPFMHFTFTGKYVAVSDAAIAAGAVYTAFQLPVASIPAKSGTITLGGYGCKISKLSCDMANDVSHALWMNAETLGIVDRKPKGTISVELVTVATKDYWTLVRNATTAALVFTQGLVAGNISEFTAPAVQLAKVKEYEFEGVLGLEFDAVFAPSAGNDEVKLKLT